MSEMKSRVSTIFLTANRKSTSKPKFSVMSTYNGTSIEFADSGPPKGQ